MLRMNKVYVDLGYNPRQWQREMHAALKRFSVLVCHRRAGKTVSAVMTLIDAALRSQRGNGRYAYIAPLLKQSKAVAWDYLKHYGCKVPGAKVNESELSIDFPNGSRIRLYGADNPDSLRGLFLDGAVLDEVAQMKPEIWGEIIRPALADRLGWALFIGTPKGVNLFSDLYYRAEGDPEWYARVYTCNDTKALSPSEIDAMRKEMSENEFRQEMLCDFSAATDDTLISMELADGAMGKQLHESSYSFAPKILGVDVARYGNDRSVIFPRQGLAGFKPKIYADISNMDLAASVAEASDRWGADAIMIDAGRGEGVIDRLLQLGYSPLPVNFGGTPSHPRFVNKRAEMWWAMMEWLKAGGCLPNIPELRRDLCTPEYTYANAAGKLALESKDKIKERGMPSPDLADALACTFAYPVVKGNSEHANRAVNHEYHPFDALERSHINDNHARMVWE